MAGGGSSKGGLCNQEKQGWTVSVQHWERVGTWLQELSFNQPDCMQLPNHCHFYYYCYYYYYYYCHFYYYYY